MAEICIKYFHENASFNFSNTLSSGKKGRKTSLLVLGKTVCIGNSNTDMDPGFVDIKSKAILAKNFKHRVLSTKYL